MLRTIYVFLYVSIALAQWGKLGVHEDISLLSLQSNQNDSQTHLDNIEMIY